MLKKRFHKKLYKKIKKLQDHSEDKFSPITFNSSIFHRGLLEKRSQGKSSKSDTPGQLCDWACLCWLAGRVGWHRIMLISEEKERRLARSLNRVSGPAARRKRQVVPCPAAAPGTGVK